MTTHQAESSGFVARLTNKARIPTNDFRLYREIEKAIQCQDLNIILKVTANALTLCDAWLNGWDNAHQEHRKFIKLLGINPNYEAEAAREERIIPIRELVKSYSKREEALKQAN